VKSQQTKTCFSGYTLMPDGNCCKKDLVSADGKSCMISPSPGSSMQPSGRVKPAVDCSTRGSNYIRDPRNSKGCVPCKRGLVANADHSQCVNAAQDRTVRKPPAKSWRKVPPPIILPPPRIKAPPVILPIRKVGPVIRYPVRRPTTPGIFVPRR